MNALAERSPSAARSRSGQPSMSNHSPHVYRLSGDGRRPELSLVLQEGRQIVGSGPRADLRLEDSTVSRRHAEIDVGSVISVRDLGSKNGTAIDGRPIRESELEVGNCLELGGVALVLERVEPRDTELAVSFEAEGPVEGESLATTEAGPVAAFALFHLPLVLRDLSAGRSTSTVAQKLGHALLSSRIVESVEIVAHDDSETETVLFASDPTEADTEGIVRVTQGCFELRARTVGRSDNALQCLHSAALLLGLGASGQPSEEEALRPESGPPPLPEPATVDATTRQLYRRAARVADSHIGIMICGESGTGKEIFARYVQAASSRPDAPLVCVNCAALPRDLLEAELFGIEQGVATGVTSRAGIFEQAHGGTVFLDEIGDMPLETQALLLRVLQEKEVVRIGGSRPRQASVRVLAATNRDLDEMLSEERFREDLYYRIATWIVRLPSLRERRADIANLAAYFVERESRKLGRGIAGISRGAVDALLAYDWPGNIRQLELEMARAVAFAPRGGVVDSASLSSDVLAGPTNPGETLERRIEYFARREILRALQSAQNDVNQAAKALGVSRATLYRRIKALKIPTAAIESRT